jgi:hypothetical protein
MLALEIIRVHAPVHGEPLAEIISMLLRRRDIWLNLVLILLLAFRVGSPVLLLFDLGRRGSRFVERLEELGLLVT